MNLYKIISYFLIILIPIIIVFGNFRVLAYNLNFYQILYEKSGVYNKFTQNQAKDYTINLHGYIRGINNLDTNFYSKQAVLHLRDVKLLFFQATGLLYLSLFFFSFAGTYLFFKSPKLLINSLLLGSLLTELFILLLASGLFLGFEPFFEVFHKLTFSNDLWLFPPEDTLIQLFPPQFFQLFSNILAFNIFVTSAVIAFFSYILKNKKNVPD